MEKCKNNLLLKSISTFLIFFLIGLSILPFLSSCQKSCNPVKSTGKLSQDSTVYSLENFTPYTLDTFLLSKYIAQDSSHLLIQEDLMEFYQKRYYQYAWFTQKGISDAVPLLLNRIQNSSTTLPVNYLKKINQFKDSLRLDSTFLIRNKKNLAQYELDLTSAYFQYAKYEFYGIDKNPKDLEWFIPRKKKNYQLLLERIACCDKEHTNFEPTNSYYRRLKSELVKYREIEPMLKDQKLHCDTFPLKKNDTAGVLILIKERLSLLGDLSKNDSCNFFSEELTVAIKKFQYRNGIDTTGEINKITFAELQKPISTYLRKIIINMERLRWMTDSIPDTYILVNIPEFKLHVFDKGSLDWSMNVVVGAQATTTSIFEDEMSHVVINPYWGVPNSIVKNEIIPAMLRNSDYINRNNMEVLKNNVVVSPYSIAWYDIKGNPPFTIRQKPGPNNALGKVKLLFPNDFNIYFHDTPAKKYFVERKRAYSHGCIRLAEPLKLAEYILLRDSIYTKSQFDKEISKSKENWISLRHRFPVIISYFTAWVDSKGDLQFREDVYGHDRKLEEEMFD